MQPAATINCKPMPEPSNPALYLRWPLPARPIAWVLPTLALAAHWVLLFSAWLSLGFLGLGHGWAALNGLALLALWWPMTTLGLASAKRGTPLQTHAPRQYNFLSHCLPACALCVLWPITLRASPGTAAEVATLALCVAWALACRTSLHITRSAAKAIGVWERWISAPLGAALAWGLHTLGFWQGQRADGLWVCVWLALWSLLWAWAWRKPSAALQRAADSGRLPSSKPDGLHRGPTSTSIALEAFSARAAHLSMGIMMAGLVWAGQWCAATGWSATQLTAMHMGWMVVMPALVSASGADRWTALRGYVGVACAALLALGGLGLWLRPDPVGLMLCMALHALAWALGLKPQRPMACSLQNPGNAFAMGPSWLWSLAGGLSLAGVGLLVPHLGPRVLFAAHGSISALALAYLLGIALLRSCATVIGPGKPDAAR